MSASVSELHFYSLGIVANNKPLNTNSIVAVPTESLTLLDGEIASIPVDKDFEGLDASGNVYSGKVTTDIAVEASWFPLGCPNRLTAPDVRRGETVLLWQFADRNSYHWTSLKQEVSLRKLETVIYAFSGTADEAADGSLPENSYSLEISTHKGLITLRTSQVNNEFCTYVFQINAKEGRVILTDELGNELLLDSALGKISLTNQAGTTVQLDKARIVASAKDSITLDAKRLLSLITKDLQIKTDTMRITTTTGTVIGKVEFADEVTFKKKITAAGMDSSLPITGPNGSI